MSSLLSVLAFAVVMAGFLGLTFAFAAASRRLLPEETGRTPLYRERGGGRFALLNVTMPFVRVTVYPDLAVFRHFAAIVVRPGDLTGLRVLRGFIRHGVQLEHRNAGLPDPFIVWSRSPDSLATVLRPFVSTISQGGPRPSGPFGAG